MDGNDIVFWFSFFVGICVTIWAVVVIRAYLKIGKD